MERKEYRHWAHRTADFSADYLENVENYPVLPATKPGDILRQIPEPPDQPEDFEKILDDLKNIIMPGMTHWQNPSFFGYFPANSGPPSVLAETLTATLAAQCMIWQTSPAAAELEERMMQWLAKICDLPKNWHGVIQDTASSATFCALLNAREKATNYKINEEGFDGTKFICYSSSHTHSSLDKAVKMAGIGSSNLRKIAVNEDFSVSAEDLEKSIREDLARAEAGEKIRPLFVTATLGSTSSTAFDDLKAVGEVCKKYGLWLHVDAAYAGSVAILEEKRYLFAGLEYADSYVFNPHKWLFTNFDCTAFYVKDKAALINTFSESPEYLRTGNDEAVNNYRDWGIQLGRRFRALKLWFVIRSYGLSGLQEKLRLHMNLAEKFKKFVEEKPDFVIAAPVSLNLVCFYRKTGGSLEEQNDYNSRLMKRLNDTGKVFLSHTKLDGKYVLRVVTGQTYVEEKHLNALISLINSTCREMETD